MKKILTLIVLLALCTVVSAFPQTGVAADIFSAQDLIIKKGSLQINADLRLKVSSDFEVRLPLTFTTNHNTWMADGALALVYYPLPVKLYFGITAVQFGYYDASLLAMNEVFAGWTFDFRNSGFFLEPELCIRDPSATYTDEYSVLRGIFPSYGSFRIRLKAGWKFFKEENI